MDEQELVAKIEQQDGKLDAIYRSVEKTRKYFLWTLIISVAMIVLPLLGLAIIIPMVFKTISSAYGL